MTIDQARASFDAHLDGELGPEDTAAFDELLRSNPALTAEWEAYKATVQTLQGLPEKAPPSDLMESTTRRWRRRQRLRYYEDDRSHRYRLELALCVILVIALVAIGGLSSFTTDPSAEFRPSDAVTNAPASVPLVQWLPAFGAVTDLSPEEPERPRVQLDLPSEREGAFRATLSSYPQWEIESRVLIPSQKIRYTLQKNGPTSGVPSSQSP